MPADIVPIVIDIEASGFGRGSYPIEVGFVLENGDTQCTLIKPDPDWTHWDPESEALHGITRTILETHGKPIQWVAQWLNEHLHGRDVYSDAWGNDMCWLGLLFEYAEMSQHFHLEAIAKLLNDQQMDKWADLREQSFASLKLRRHRASADALAIQQTYLSSLPEPIKNKPVLQRHRG